MITHHFPHLVATVEPKIEYNQLNITKLIQILETLVNMKMNDQIETNISEHLKFCLMITKNTC